jgi:hypothetical protein
VTVISGAPVKGAVTGSSSFEHETTNTIAKIQLPK